MTDQVRSDVSTEQTTQPITQRRKLLQLREANRERYFKILEEFGEPLQFFGVYDEPFPDEG
jgi:hypothetical protein